MAKWRNIFLIGPMGSGKSSIGKQLAKSLKVEFYDSDTTIEERTGVDIAWIFDTEGEAGFRKRESSVVDELTQLEGIVLATGGGVVLNASNRAALASRGTVIYLKTSVEQQVKRTARDKNRPLLSNKGERKDVLEQLIVERDPIYAELADHICETDKRSVYFMVKEIMKMLGEEE